VLTVSPGNVRRRHRSANGQSQNERPTHVLHKPDKIISYRHCVDIPQNIVVPHLEQLGDEPACQHSDAAVGTNMRTSGMENNACSRPRVSTKDGNLGLALNC
jgi:hypothetical protein